MCVLMVAIHPFYESPSHTRPLALPRRGSPRQTVAGQKYLPLEYSAVGRRIYCLVD
jgi:hypothetical protein